MKAFTEAQAKQKPFPCVRPIPSERHERVVSQWHVLSQRGTILATVKPRQSLQSKFHRELNQGNYVDRNLSHVPIYSALAARYKVGRVSHSVCRMVSHIWSRGFRLIVVYCLPATLRTLSDMSPQITPSTVSQDFTTAMCSFWLSHEPHAIKRPRYAPASQLVLFRIVVACLLGILIPLPLPSSAWRDFQWLDCPLQQCAYWLTSHRGTHGFFSPCRVRVVCGRSSTPAILAGNQL